MASLCFVYSSLKQIRELLVVVLANIHAELTGCQALFEVPNGHEPIQSPKPYQQETLKPFAVGQIFPVPLQALSHLTMPILLERDVAT